MKPHPHGPRLIVMRGVGIAVSVVAGALVLVGCASGQSAAGSSSVETVLSSPSPEVSIGSPAPSDAAERSRVQAVTELAQRLLAEMEMAVPAGSTEFGGQSLGVLTAPLTSMDDDVIDVAESWTVPDTADVVLTYVLHHLPAGLTSEGTGGGPVGAEVVFDRTPAGPFDEGATVYIEVAPDRASGTDLRVDVQDTWQPVRPRLEQVPANVAGATLVRRTDLRESPSPPMTIHVGADVARHIAALFNALPSEAGGPADAGGGADTTITVSFDGDPGNVQYVVAGSFYDAVTVRAASQAMPTLSGAGDLDNYLEGLF
jgi:hypothetical protein